MEYKKTQSKGQQKRDQVEKELESLNLAKQNEVLLEKGFNNQKKNLKFLKQFNGDIQKVLDYYEVKLKQKEQRIYKKLAALGLVEKNQQLIDMGYKDVKLNLRCLKLSNFIVEDAAIRLCQKGKPNSEQIFDLHQKVKELITQGFKNYKKNQNILKKVGGDIKEAIELLKEKGQKKELRLKVKQLAGQETLTKQANEIEFYGKTLYLDGNNIIFTDDIIRQTYLKKKRQIGEKMLEAVAIKFAQLQKMSKLVLIFDGRGQKVNQIIEKLEFERTFAEAENFKISDDYLAKEALCQENKEKIIFVTSDRELIDRILLAKCQFVIKSSIWMESAKELIGKNEFEKMLLSIE